MNEIMTFSNSEFGEIRTVTIDGEPWFVGNDVAKILGYAKPKGAVQNHVDAEDKRVAPIQGPTGEVGMTIIDESGVYSLIFGSKLESAKRFKTWVTKEVLPTIRKTGSYGQTQLPQLPQTTMELLELHYKALKEVGGKVEVLADDLNEVKGDYGKRIEHLENNMTLDYGQQRSLEDAVNKTVMEAVGGKESNAYKSISRKVFSECNRDLKHYFNVNARNNVPKKRFDEAVEYANNWKPCTNTMMLIRDYNAQQTLEM